MTNKLRWRLGFAKAVHLRGHKKYRIRRKNIDRTMRLKIKPFGTGMFSSSSRMAINKGVTLNGK